MDTSAYEKQSIGYMWKKITETSKEQKYGSFRSRGGSAKGKKFLPYREYATPYRSIRMSSIKSGLSELKESRIKNNNGEKDPKYILREHRSIVSLLKKMSNENKEYSFDNQIATARLQQLESTSRKRVSYFKNEQNTSQNSNTEMNEMEPTTYTLINGYKSIGKYILRLDLQNYDKYQPTYGSTENKYIGKILPIYYLLRNCLEQLDRTYSELQTKRLYIQRALEYRQSYFQEVKYKILREFAKRYKQIYDQNLREVIKEYIPEYKNTLMRVTSYRIFNRNKYDAENAAYNSYKKLGSGIFADLKQLQDLKSVRSGYTSNCRQNFDLIFGAIHQIKSVLHENYPNTAKLSFISNNVDRKGRKNNQYLKPVKVSLLDIKNREYQGSSRRLKLSQIVKDISSLKV